MVEVAEVVGIHCHLVMVGVVGVVGIHCHLGMVGVVEILHLCLNQKAALAEIRRSNVNQVSVIHHLKQIELVGNVAEIRKNYFLIFEGNLF